MNTVYKSYYSIFWLCFLYLILFYQTDISAQAKTSVTIKEKFDLGSTLGERDIYKVDINAPGQIYIKVNWVGSAARLALILNGPGQVNHYARKDGKSPIEINFNITPELLSKGKTWTISIINFGNRGSAKGELNVKYPVKLRTLQEPPRLTNQKPRLTNQKPRLTNQKPRVATPVAKSNDELDSSISQENTLQRTILEDGTVEIRYPDGTIKHVFQCGYMIFKPDGTSSGVSCLQVQPTTPPALPGDDRISVWLDWQAQSLLDLIKVLLEADEVSIENFLNNERETATNIYQKMYIRTNYIDRLLSQ